jgi:hypothetical protein
MLAVMPLLNQNNGFSNTIMAQALDSYSDSTVSYYPTNINKYECKKGAFEGFFVSTLEFCNAKFTENGKQDPPSVSEGMQAIQGISEAIGAIDQSGQKQINSSSLYYRNGNLATTDMTSQIVSVAFCDPGDIVLKGSYQLSNRQDNPILGFISSIVEDKNTYNTAVISTNVTLQSIALCSNNS